MAVYSYLRVSTNKQADSGIGIDVQRRMVGGYLTILGLELGREFMETAVSGSVPFRERPEGAALGEVLRRGDVVVAAKLDRMFRSAADALAVLERCQRMGVTLHLIDLGGDVTGPGIGKLVFTILAAVAEQERDRIRERVREVKADGRARGVFLGGRAPIGFEIIMGGPDGKTKMLGESPTQQAVIEEIKSLHRQGLSLRKIKGRLYGHERMSLSAIARICSTDKPAGGGTGI